MNVGSSMTSDVKMLSPDDTIRAAAEIVASMDIGLLPVKRTIGWSAWSPTVTLQCAAWRRQAGRTRGSAR